MKKGVLLLVVCASLYVQSAPTDMEMVWLKDVTTSFQTDKRKLGDPDLPDDLTFQLKRHSQAFTLNLKRNYGINPNADVYVVRKLNDGRYHFEKSLDLEKQDLAYYQDVKNGAYMTIRCVRRSSGHCDRVIDGNIRIEERNYDLRPVKTVITSRDFMAAPDHLGMQYVLRDQANVQAEISFTNKDSTTFNDENVEQKLRNLLRRFPNGQKHFPSLNFTLPSRHGRDTLKHVYYVEIAVVLDSGICDFHSSLMQTNHAPKRASDLRRKLREFYSHIINGVDLDYKRINDPDIEIGVIIAEFYIYEDKADFGQDLSLDEKTEARYKIDVHLYIKDLERLSSQIGSFSDHVMLFTRYDIYDGSHRNRDLKGFSSLGLVCDSHEKVSIIESRDYFLTVNTASHELGHNLGAEHDGIETTRACRAEDLYIMTPGDPYFLDDKSYSRNAWMFSNCSVKAFKDTLKTKKCLTNVGFSYNKKEWAQFMTQLPGEVYSSDEQCVFINGPDSAVCETSPDDICLFMKCTDPITKRCVQTFFIAATGTDCGQNKWCKEGLCVSKPTK